MSFNLVLPFFSSAIMVVFTISVLRRYAARRSLHFLFWGIGLGMFAIASLAEAYLALAWNRWAFFAWYLFGAVMTAAWIGHGTTYLMFRKRWVHVLTGLLAAGSLFAVYLMTQALDRIDPTVFSTSRPISEQYATRRLEEGQAAPEGVETAVIEYRGEQVTVTSGLLPLGTPVRLTTPFFNIYGLLSLVGGALWSAVLFLRKRVLPNRVIGNVLIAAGALLVGTASTLTRLGYGEFLYLGELLAALVMFAGFRVAARPEPAEALQAFPASAT